MTATLEQLASRKTLVTVYREIEDVENIHGFVLATSSRLVLLHEVTEFHLDGFCILDRGDITKARNSKFERYRAAILKAEKILSRVGLDAEIDLTDWESALRSLKKRGENVIVEGERPEVDEFLIGEILRINKKSVTMQSFDALGVWESESHRLSYKEITSVSFGNEYVTMFSKYLRDTG